jgi:uncharacterized protein (DUF305 family)
MMKQLFLAAAIAAIPFVALAQQMHHGAAAGDAMTQAHQKMMTAMQAVQPTGDTDRDFVLMMIPHHQGAIDMAKAELEHGKDETLRAMAEEIITAQEKEIGEMEAWLKANP